MRKQSNVIDRPRVTPHTAGLLLGALGVLGFSLSLPATRLAVVNGLDPWFVAFGRAVGAGLLAAGYLWLTRAPRPDRSQTRRLLVVACGIVVGFPLFTSLALTTQTSAHGAVVVACLPMCTAIFAILRAGERPRLGFWVASTLGLLAVLVFVFVTGGAFGSLELADLFLFAGVVLCAMGYAEGGALARELGGPRVVSWALVLSLPVTVPVTAVAVGMTGLSHATGEAWLGFGYVTLVSMYLGFFAWYAGLARGGVARVGQVQLAQPVLTLAFSALLLSEPVGWTAIATALAVLACVVATQRTRG